MRSLRLRLKAFRRGVDLVLGPRALQVVEVILPTSTSAGDLARDGLLLECLFCGRAILGVLRLPRRQHAGLPLLSMTLNASQTLLLEQRRGMIDLALLDALDVLRIVPSSCLLYTSPSPRDRG